MRLACTGWRRALAAVLFSLAFAPNVATAQPPALTSEQIKHFLATAKVIKSSQTEKGVTNPYRLTLTDGTLTHDGAFQSIDERRLLREFPNGVREVNFVDSYKYNVAAYLVAEMLGVEDMMPVYVERRWEGRVGSISWWLTVMMDEADRLNRRLPVPDQYQTAWNNQMHRVRVFDALIYDTDVNVTNLLIGPDWKVYRVDFSRAFRVHSELPNPAVLLRVDRQFLTRLKALDGAAVAANTKRFLTAWEVRGLMARRDKIVSHFERAIADKGEQTVLYDFP